MPSTSIQAVDERLLPFDPEPIWTVLADVASTPGWWPGSVRITILTHAPGIVGTEFELRPGGGRPFRCRIESIDPPRSMRTRYENGFVTGGGEWRLDPTPAGTRVRYAIAVQAHGWLVAVLGRLVPLNRLHSRAMQEVLACLEAEVRRRRGSHPPSP